ncbi:MAG: hypothetical protein JXB50_10445 [Spirochaetes bacterium]|nr:hypothetical protein [Spirochaetota bacterium]
MKWNKTLLIFLILIFIITSCGEPPDGTEEIKLILFIKRNIDILNEIKNDEEKFLKYFKDMSNNLRLVLSYEKDTTILIRSKKITPEPDDFIYSLDDNRFMVCKSLYMTFYKKETIFSFDKKIWYSSLNDANKEIEGVRNNYFVNSKIDDKTLYIDYKMAFSPGRNPKTVNFNEARQTVTLKKGMVFSNMDKNKINTNLTEKILYVPQNTMLSGNVNVTGNIINSQSKDNVICLKAMQNLYFFIRKMMFSFSFDKVNWNLNLLSFSVDPKVEVYAKDDNHVFFDVTAEANYNAEKSSMSLIKLIVDAAF